MVNAYLVREDDGLTLIDTMLGGSEGKIIAAAEASGAPIVRILLTHAHADHIGSLDALKARLPNAEVIISTRDARLLAKDMSLDPDEPKAKAPRRLPGGRDQAQPNRRPWRSGRLARGDRRPATPPATSPCSTFVTARSTAAMPTPPSAAS